MQRLSGGLVFICLLSAFTLSAQGQHTKDSLETVKKRIKEKKAVLIDVREQNEWDAGHLKGARLIPLTRIRQGVKEKTLPKDKIIYCHCRSGGRVLIATSILKPLGYDIRPLKQGYQQLLAAGFEKAADSPKRK
ncbi:MAG TPA: rhodanese-like domain-containing protein [Planctomycetaceae bacterium]|nr:rhodanese-like domain-containing protein [Planctomycetaceae bacterium]